jgi:hypothetical protein
MKGVVYNGVATLGSALIGKVTNLWVFLVLFLILNIIAYPLAHLKMPKKRFEGGAVSLDKYVARWFKYKFYGKNLYTRKGRYDIQLRYVKKGVQ